MSKHTDLWLDNHKEELISSLQECLKIRSVEGPAEEGAPFGVEIKKALDCALLKAESLGFETKNLDGYCGCIDAGQGKELLGILSHLDVVPEYTGWEYPPYSAEIHDGKLWGRGTVDDKGPAYAALFALAAVKSTGAEFKRRVRIILGCNEESRMACLEHYKQVEEIPTVSFSPDGDYPVTNSEKTILQFRITKKYASHISAASGEVANVVPAFAECLAKRVDGTVQRVSVKGKAAHASLPWQGENAISLLLKEMDQMELYPEEQLMVRTLKNAFCDAFYGQGINLDVSDYSGRMTVNLGVLRWNADGFSLTMDMRVPTSLTEAEVKEALTKALAPAGFEFEDWAFKQGFSVPEDSELVSKLLDCFKERTGIADAKPIQIGGGTYARQLPNAVSFGPENYMCDASAHVANEYITIDQLMFNAKLYADAIEALAL